MVFGSMPNDGGNLIIEENEYAAFLQQEPEAEQYIRPFLGAEEFINNKKRYCLWLLNAEPQHLKKCPLIVARVRGAYFTNAHGVDAYRMRAVGNALPLFCADRV